MRPRKISDRVDSVGAVDWDRRLFDALIPLPDGTSYNAYVVKGVDYVVAHHAEQDHAGAIHAALERHPAVAAKHRAAGILSGEPHVTQEA